MAPKWGTPDQYRGLRAQNDLARDMNFLQNSNDISSGLGNRFSFTKTAKGGCACTCNGHCQYPDWCEKCQVVKCRPEVPSSWVPGTLGTTYKREYPEKGAPGDVRSYIPLAGKQFIPEMIPLSTATTNRVDFPPKKAPGRHNRAQATVLPLDPFNHSTTNADFYKGIQGVRSYPPPGSVPSLNLPFTGLSSYAADFRSIPQGPRPLQPTPRPALQIPFSGLSEYKQKFVGEGGDQRRASMKPSTALLPSANEPSLSTYASDFRRRPPSGRQIPRCCDVPSHRSSMRPEEFKCGAVRVTERESQAWR